MSAYGTGSNPTGSGANDFQPYTFGDFASEQSSLGNNPNSNNPSGKSQTGFGGGAPSPARPASGMGGAAGDLSSVTIPVSAPTVTGHMGYGNAEGQPRPTLDTLDEPVWETIRRDLLNIWAKLKQVLLPRPNTTNILKDWDLWGPLLLCLVLSIRLSITAPNDQAAGMFTAIFIILWCGAAAVTLNAKLLGGKISFFQSVCVLGYCVFPLVIASIVCGIIRPVFVRMIVILGAFLWAVYASIGFFSDLNLNQRRVLAIYPIFLFYFVIGWMILIS
ncbi:protein YIPF6 [Fimicolochytrium jonesii]|uniref:protein YIPF6 n=1 Tax=Fimicolochytrium jonesii TaxID=1396493 RepID=UPI0022FF0EA7|nr:protein YIPF6 [Fimicolochytrium jonesii]KAI8819477.1 protein YIPF6 [Fimicolochytrium jonesii]